MNEMELLVKFMEAAKEDARIGMSHISLYAALITLPVIRRETPLCVFAKDVMPYCKLYSKATYNRTLRQLHEFGYIRYLPSYNHFLGSLIYLEF